METFKEHNMISAAILAGGANKRFHGKTKANIQISGVRIITRTIKVLHEIFDDIIIVTNTPDQFKGYNHFTMVPDTIKNVGPLGGIHAAMQVAKNDAVFVFASDMPCISGDVVKKHIEFYEKRDCDAAIPKVKDLKEPLHSIYNKRILDQLDAFLQSTNKYSIENFLKDLNVRYHNLEETDEYKRAFLNINTPKDLSCLELYATNNHS